MKTFKEFFVESVGGKLIGKVGDYNIHHDKDKETYHVQNTKNPEASFRVTHDDFDTDRVEMPRRGSGDTLTDEVKHSMYKHVHNQVKDYISNKIDSSSVAEKINRHLEPVIADHADAIADQHDYEDTLRRLPR